MSAHAAGEVIEVINVRRDNLQLAVKIRDREAGKRYAIYSIFCGRGSAGEGTCAARSKRRADLAKSTKLGPIWRH